MKTLNIATLIAAMAVCGFGAAQAPVATSMEHALGLMGTEEVVWPDGPSADGGPRGSGAGTALPVLLETAQAEDEHERVRALEALAKLDAQGQAEVFYQALSDSSSRVREVAARVVCQFEPDAVFERVMSDLCGPSAGRFDDSLILLRKPLERRMLDVAQSPEEAVGRRAAAAYALGRMGSATAVPALAQLAWGNDEWLASVAVQAILNVADPVVIPKLSDLTAHPSAQIRWNALEGLGALGGPEAIQALGRVAVMRPADDKELSRRAVQLLGATEDPAVIPILIEAMSRNDAVQRLAVDALSQLTGKDFGDLPAVWIEWWQRLNEPTRVQPVGPPPKLPFEVDYM